MIPDSPNISWATIMISALIILDVSTEIGEYHAAIKHSIKWGKDARIQRQVCKTVNIVALQVAAVAMSLIFGSAMLVTHLTDGMDTRMALILEGISRLEAAHLVCCVTCLSMYDTGIQYAISHSIDFIK